MTIAEVLRTYIRIAVVGLSSQPGRPSHGVAKYLKANGYQIVPVNQNEDEVLGEKAKQPVAEPCGIARKGLRVTRREERRARCSSS